MLTNILSIFWSSVSLDAFLAMNNAHRRTFALNFREMAGIAEAWVKTVMRLSDRNLQRMQKLTSAQTKRMKRTATAAISPVGEG
jgi:hypothetical protein